MTEELKKVELIKIGEITVINPRARSRKVFGELVASISSVGLKKPITVSRIPDRPGFYLVCGQGRMEALIELGEDTIPAVIMKASYEECMVMSLVENLARRPHSPLELVAEIGALRKRGYSISEIALKTGLSQEYSQAFCFLLEHGEEKLLAGVERGIIPPSIATEIARAKDGNVQNSLTEAYEQRLLPGNQVLAIRKIIESRDLLGKDFPKNNRQKGNPNKGVTAHSLVRAYKKESDRQRAFIKNANLTNTRLVFVLGSLKRLLDDEHFVTLLRAEQLMTMPRQIAEILPAIRG
jgi:ParB family chromosome partitioning protein